MKLTLVALNAHFQHTNLAIRQLFPTLRDIEGVETCLFEAHINLPYHQLLEGIARGTPGVIAFSCYIWNIELVLRLCRALRLALPNAVIVLGGPEVAHRQACPPEADYVLAGEGEAALPWLIRALMQGKKPESMPKAPHPLDPSEWPDPYAEGIKGLEDRILYIETSRGCPYRCAYCLSASEPKVRALPEEEAVRRLTKLADQGAKLIKLVDRTFNFDCRRADVIWNGLIEHAEATGFEGTYHFEIGGDLLNEASLAVLGKAPKGLFQFEIGVQSSDVGVLANVARSARFQDVARGALRVCALGTIHLHLDLIAGMPGDSFLSFGRSFDDVYLLQPDMLQLGFLKLLHGSPLRRDADLWGIRFEPDAPYEVIATNDICFDELCWLKDVEKVLDWFYNSGRFRLCLRWLLRDEMSPFAFFCELAAKFRTQGVFDAERGGRARAQALLEAHDSPELRALMTHELLTSGRRRELPEVLGFSEDQRQRALLREKFHPVRGQSVCRYAFDVEGYASGGELVPCEVELLYP